MYRVLIAPESRTHSTAKDEEVVVYFHLAVKGFMSDICVHQLAVE